LNSVSVVKRLEPRREAWSADCDRCRQQDSLRTAGSRLSLPPRGRGHAWDPAEGCLV